MWSRCSLLHVFRYSRRLSFTSCTFSPFSLSVNYLCVLLLFYVLLFPLSMFWCFSDMFLICLCGVFVGVSVGVSSGRPDPVRDPFQRGRLLLVILQDGSGRPVCFALIIDTLRRKLCDSLRLFLQVGRDPSGLPDLVRLHRWKRPGCDMFQDMF